jgi:hypothetical protein
MQEKESAVGDFIVRRDIIIEGEPNIIEEQDAVDRNNQQSRYGELFDALRIFHGHVINEDGDITETGDDKEEIKAACHFEDRPYAAAGNPFKKKGDKIKVHRNEGEGEYLEKYGSLCGIGIVFARIIGKNKYNN